MFRLVVAYNYIDVDNTVYKIYNEEIQISRLWIQSVFTARGRIRGRGADTL
jgi:hypothetical protein